MAFAAAQTGRCADSLLRSAADMDDTLVLTADADAASHAAVLDVLHETVSNGKHKLSYRLP